MAEKTSIEWTDATWTPIRARWFEIQGDGGSRERVGWHCEHVSDGCRNCYAESINLRLGTGLPFKPVHLKHKTALGDTQGDVEVFLDEGMLARPLFWRRPREIFVCSMTDLFASFVCDEWIDAVFGVMALAQHHTFQVLTKRSDRMRRYLTERAAGGRFVWEAAQRLNEHLPSGFTIRETAWPLPNVTLMVSAETQREANKRIPDLLATPAARRGLSLEPLLGPVRIEQSTDLADGGMIDWVITGGESGPRARPPHPQWFRDLRDECEAFGVPFMFKQWGSWVSVSEQPGDGPHHTFTDGATVRRVGKKAAGRLLDGVEHNGAPR